MLLRAHRSAQLSLKSRGQSSALVLACGAELGRPLRLWRLQQPKKQRPAAIYKRALEQFGGVPSPHGKGWQVMDGNIKIHWMRLPPAPDSIIEFVNCTCKKTQCKQGRCSCFEKSLPCTDLCKCINCENIAENDMYAECESDSEEE